MIFPKLSADGSCSILEEKSDTPYNLAETFGIIKPHSNPLLKGEGKRKDFLLKEMRKNSHTLRLWRFGIIKENVSKATHVDWFGIYRKLRNSNGEIVLAKESYFGVFSRPEFPLTEEFAKKSNNSTVGLTGKAIVIQDVYAHSGAYYKCDGKVQSEFCVPILDKSNSVIGILDAESLPKNFYTDERLLQIAKVAYDLGKINLGI